MPISDTGDPGRKTALIYDRLDGFAGGERVLEQQIMLNPHADVFASIDILKPHERGFLRGKAPITSFASPRPETIPRGGG